MSSLRGLGTLPWSEEPEAGESCQGLRVHASLCLPVAPWPLSKRGCPGPLLSPDDHRRRDLVVCAATERGSPVLRCHARQPCPQ